MMPTMTNEHTNYDELAFDLECPTCEERATFIYRGKQIFPEVVAKKLGLPTDIHLWSCSHCHSTISHIDLGIEL
jgi:Zn finger protein HypA/HybF involved in hydrogenase expression